MHEGMLSYFDQADNAFVSAYRKEHKDGTFPIKLDYVSSPDLEGRTLIICDPMLATGHSLVASLEGLIKFSQPEHIFIAAIIASKQGIDFLERHYPNATLWTAAIDDELTAKSYIVPGLGDAGDLAFGPKKHGDIV